MIVIPTATGIVRFATEQERLSMRDCWVLSLNFSICHVALLAVALVIAEPAAASDKSRLVVRGDSMMKK